MGKRQLYEIFKLALMDFIEDDAVIRSRTYSQRETTKRSIKKE